MKIGIIGAGPRGLSVAERILYNNQGRHSLELILLIQKVQAVEFGG